MLNRLISFSLKNRLFVIAASALLLIYGSYTFSQLPVDVLPDLNRPQVTIFLEANGMAPEEIETQVVLPLEVALNGAPGVERVRSASSSGIGMVFVEFGWNTDIYRDRQLVSEKLQTVVLPDGIVPVMGPISSVMGQIMLVGLSADTTSAADLRTLADFTIRRRLMSIKGISQVIPIGGERKQYQVLISTQKLKQFGLSMDDVDAALQQGNSNSTGGFYEEAGSEVLIRNIGRINSLADLENTVISNKNGAPVLLEDVAELRIGAALKRGDAGINGKPAVILSVEKQPGASTTDLTDEVMKALDELKAALPSDVKINPELFQQKGFIVNSLRNVEEALRDGFILIVIILFLFLANLRTTIITLTAIPLSLVITAAIFKTFEISINTLTLGGLAIAIGELVDDAIVDVENVYRRLRENRMLAHPRPVMQVVYEASSEVRNSIVYATIIVVLVFIPLFYLEGIEGKIFAPLGVAYITSIIASLLVSLTLTPALCSYLLGSNSKRSLWKIIKGRFRKQEVITEPQDTHEKETRLVKWLKARDNKLLDKILQRPKAVLLAVGVLTIASFAVIPFFGTEFLPAFNEGSFTVNLSAPPGTSLQESNRIGALAEKLILEIPEVHYVSRRTGRAELDEHVEPVSNSELDVELKEEVERSRDEILADLRNKLSVLKGLNINIGQPISHRLDHLLSGVRAQIAIKIFGPDLDELRLKAGEINSLIKSVPGVVDAQVERQVLIPQLQIKINREALKRYGIQAGKVAEDLEIFFNGKVESQVIEGQMYFDVLLRSPDNERNNTEAIKRTMISAADGTLIPLENIADIEYAPSQNSIYHENTQRRIVVSCNVQDRDLGSTVKELQERIKTDVPLSNGYYITYGGQFESQQSASRMILILSLLSFAGIFIVLFSHFRTAGIVLQIMLNIPLALIGSVIAVALSGGTFSVATLVGFITLTGIASRNGIMMISHYIHLVEHEGEVFGKKMIIRGSLERLIPVMMTALVAALALIPLTLDAQAPGKEILYPVAVVILGGLISSTLLDIVVTPVVFYLYGEKALEKYFSRKKKADELSSTTAPHLS